VLTAARSPGSGEVGARSPAEAIAIT